MTAKMQPGYLLLPKKHSFRGITNIRVVFFADSWRSLEFWLL